jgi:hypothetical protein
VAKRSVQLGQLEARKALRNFGPSYGIFLPSLRIKPYCLNIIASFELGGSSVRPAPGYQEGLLKAQYDLFEILPGSMPRWIGAAANRQHARKRLLELAPGASGVKYFVREFWSDRVVGVNLGLRRQGSKIREHKSS